MTDIRITVEDDRTCTVVLRGDAAAVSYGELTEAEAVAVVASLLGEIVRRR